MDRSGGTWTDERLDDLARRLDDGFSRVDADIRSLRTEVSGRFDSLDARLDSLQRTLIQFMGGITIAVLATLASVIVTQA